MGRRGHSLRHDRRLLTSAQQSIRRRSQEIEGLVVIILFFFFETMPFREFAHEDPIIA